MCGRFVLMTPTKSLSAHFRLAEEPVLEPRYNIAPTQMVAVVQLPGDSLYRELKLLRWGLVPSWAKDPSIGVRLINARAETAAEKPAFRTPFKHRRCLIPADGFYEWKAAAEQDTGHIPGLPTGLPQSKVPARRKQPYLYVMADNKPFAFAGLWDRWTGQEGQTIESVTILTVEANDLLCSVHDRMPAILPEKDYDLWLDTSVKQPERLIPLLRPYPADEMRGYPVSMKVNKSDYDGPDLIQPQSGP
jgi:putative SOS response-associated peptidase YedK